MSEGAGRVRVRALIRGRVQGVWFRGATAEQARRQGVDGWVRNCADGAVEAVFEGARDSVAALVAFVRRGPPAARVESVELHDEPPRGESGFAVQPRDQGSAASPRGILTRNS